MHPSRFNQTTNNRFERYLGLAEKLGGFGYWEHDFTSGITEVSDELLAIFEATRTESFEPSKDLKIHPEDEPSYLKSLDRLIHEKKIDDLEYRIITKTGKVKTLVHSCEVICNEKNEPEKIFGVVRDLTKIRHMESLFRKKYDFERTLKEISKTLSHSSKESLLDDITNLLPLVGTVSGALRVIFVRYDWKAKKRKIVSDWFLESQISMKSLKDYETEVDAPSHILQKKQSFEVCRVNDTDSFLYDFDLNFLKILGGKSFLTAPIVISDNLYGGIGLVFQSIPDYNFVEDRKAEETFVIQIAEIFKSLYEKILAEEKIEEERVLLTSIMSASSTAILVLNPEGKIIYANPSSETVLGIKMKDILSRTYDSPKWKSSSIEGGPWSEEQQPFLIVLRTKKPVTDIHHAIEDDSGNKKYLSINGSPVFDRDGNLNSLVFLVTDISEKVLKQKALQDSEFKYRTITELTLSMVYDLDFQSGVNYWAGAIEEITGFSEAEYTAVGFDVWSELIHPDDKERVIQQIQNCMQSRVNFLSEYRYRTKSGNYVLIEDNGIFFYNELGEPVRMLGAMINRTERKEAEQKLKDSEETLRLALDGAKMGIWRYDAATRKIFWSIQTYLIYQRTPESFDGSFESFLSFTHEEDRDALKVQVESLLFDPLNFDFFVQNRIRLPNGQIRWVEGRGMVERNANGDPIRLLGTVLDVTDMKSSEEDLRRSEERFQTFYQFSRDAIVIFQSTSLSIFDSNLAFQQLYGYQDDEIPGLKFRRLISRESLYKIRQMLKEDVLGSVEIVGIKKSGDLFPAIVTLKRFYEKDEIHIAYSIFDTTSLKEVEQLKLVNAEINSKNKLIERQKGELENTLENLKKTQAQLIHSEKLAALGQLIAGIAHEINNPIGAVKASNESMMDWQKSYGLASQLFRQALLDMPKEEKKATKQILNALSQPIDFYTGKDERNRKKKIRAWLLEKGIAGSEANYIADSWVELGIGDLREEFLPAVVSNYAKILFDYFELESQFKRSTKSIQLAVDRVSKIMYALKNFSHFDASGEKKEASIPNTIDMVLTIYQNQLKKGIELVKEYQEIPPILCYPDDLLHVWTNLIYNSLQAMSFKGKLTITVQNLDDFILVSVEDSGPGIPKEIQDKIYEPFFTTKAAGEGSGLGLDIVRKIVKKHDGRIELESKPGQTKFKIYLPI